MLLLISNLCPFEFRRRKMALTISTLERCINARINTHSTTSCSFFTTLNTSKPSKLSNRNRGGIANSRKLFHRSKKSLIGLRAIPRHAYIRATHDEIGMPTMDEENGNDKEEKWDYKKYQALLRGGEEVSSLLNEMIELLTEISMDTESEQVAVQIAAQGVVGKRVDNLDASFMMALDFMLGQTENDLNKKWLLEVIKDTVLSYLTKKLPPHVQVVGMLCRTPRKESRLELLRRVAGGGGTFDTEDGGKVVLPKANLDDVAKQADDLLETMEEKHVVPDHRLLARLVLIREEARNMMGGGILDERNNRGLSTLPDAEVAFVSKLVAVRPGPAVREKIKNVMQGRDEGAVKTATSNKKTSGHGLSQDTQKGRPVRPGMFLETVTKVLGGMYETNDAAGITVQHLEWVHKETLNILQEIAFSGS